MSDSAGPGSPGHQMAAPTLARPNSAGTPTLLYVICAASIVLAIAWVHWFIPVNIVSYERDVWHHLAVLNALLESPFHAGNPHIVSDSPSRSYMPWYVGLAILGRWFGLDSQQLLGLSAALSILTVVVGVYLFARAYFRSAWAPLALLACIFGMWIPINHTGFHTLSTMAFSASYPFAIVFGLGFVGWALIVRGLHAHTAPWIVGIAIALLTAFVFTTHQLQGGFNIGGMLALALFHGRFAVARRVHLVLSVVAGVLVSGLWHYYNPIMLALNGGYYSYVYHAPIDWQDPESLALIIGPSLLGLGGFYDQRRRAWRLDLVLGTAGITAGIVGGALMGSWIVLRLLPFLVVFLQVGFVALILDLPGRDQAGSGWRAKWMLAWLVGAMMIGNAVSTGLSVKKARDYQTGASDKHAGTWARDIKKTVREVQRIVGVGKVVIADGITAYPIQADGMKVVSIPLPFPEVPDAPIRQAASLEFFDHRTSRARRCEILETYHVNAIVYRVIMVDAEVQQQVNAMGSMTEVRDLVVVSLSNPPKGCGG